MYRIAKFEKVSFEQFEKDWLKNFPQTEDVRAVYDSIKLPKRATTGSAGYDFYAPANVCFEKGKSTLVPQKLMRAGYFQFIRVQVLALNIVASLIIQSALLIPIITILQMRGI